MELIKRLENYLNFIFYNTVVLNDGSIVEKRERVATVDGIELIIRTNDHWPPHFHAKHADFEIKVDITTGDISVIHGKIDRSIKKKIDKFRIDRSDHIKQVWNDSRTTDQEHLKIK